MSDAEKPAAAPVELFAGAIDLVIFDLDGVLTRTARVHAAAWKRVFDDFLARQAGNAFQPFDAEADYLHHVDGKPRLDGVRDFLAARAITLPRGTPADAPGSHTLWGLGNAKNDAFLALLERDGVETYPAGVALLERLRRCGFGRAVVSASRNGRRVLAAAGLIGRLDAVVDGTDAAREGLAGKPAPDTFLAAAARLGVPPSRAAVIEDAEAGVAAAHAGGFRLVIGVDRADHAGALRANGAGEVVRCLDQVQPRGLPSALVAFARIRGRLGALRPAVFLDYDGTLTPIVARPEDARLGRGMRERLAALARVCPVGVVSGRALEVIRELVGLDDVVYVTDHGFQVLFPRESPLRPGPATGIEDRVARLACELRRRLVAVPGALVEEKGFSVAVHYRLVPVTAVPRVKAAVEAMASAETGFRLLPGKKVLELQPDVDWDKGAAVRWLMQRLRLEDTQVVYIGDDVTDESAFRELRARGTTVAVQARPRPTAAHYRLRDVDAVGRFLERLAGLAAEQAPL